MSGLNVATRIEEFTFASIDHFISTTTSSICSAIAPLAIAGTTIYIMLLGYNIAFGHVQTPVAAVVKRSMVMAFVASLALSFGVYNSMVVELFQGLQTGLVSITSGNSYGSLGEALDNMGAPLLDLVNEANHQANANGNLAGIPDFSFLLVGVLAFIAWLIFFAVAVGLYIVSMIGLGLCLGVGPIFIMLALWPATASTYFKNWLNQCASFTIMTMLVSAVSMIFGSMLKQFAEHIEISESSNNLGEAGALLFMAFGLFMVLKNINSLSAALTGGTAAGGNAMDSAMSAARNISNIASRWKRGR